MFEEVLCAARSRFLAIQSRMHIRFSKIKLMNTYLKRRKYAKYLRVCLPNKGPIISLLNVLPFNKRLFGYSPNKPYDNDNVLLG